MSFPGQPGTWGPVNNYAQPWSPNNMYNQTAQMRGNQNNILKVMGPESAKAYPLGPNSSVALFDENDAIFYFKQTDASGTSSLRTFRFEEVHVAETEAMDLSGYVTKEDLAAAIGSLKNDLEKWVIDNA